MIVHNKNLLGNTGSPNKEAQVPENTDNTNIESLKKEISAVRTENKAIRKENKELKDLLLTAIEKIDSINK